MREGEGKRGKGEGKDERGRQVCARNQVTQNKKLTKPLKQVRRVCWGRGKYKDR